MNISQGLLPFQLIEDTSKVLMTSFGGLPLVMETFRALGLPQSIQKHLPLLQRQGKYRRGRLCGVFYFGLCGGRRLCG